MLPVSAIIMPERSLGKRLLTSSWDLPTLFRLSSSRIFAPR
ncbi:hypothetical protein EVA_11638 [gut metagenome]|uniref:Uncharacterized protein n=1 Tax=gut metagenome TaxID=749906 RepID=J9GKP5_9ZZZZ